MPIEMIQFNRAVTLAALVLLPLLACQLDGRLVTAKSSVRVLDESDPLDIVAIARIMCESKSKRDGQISRLSTLDKLVEFFDQQVGGGSHEFNKCKQQHGETLRLLQKALTASQENVCSAAKLALIEDFHNKFVSRLVEHKKSRKEEQREAAPQLLRLFFMHYAMEVGAVCKRSLIKNVESDLKQKLGDDVNERLFDLKDHGNGLEERALKKTMQKFDDLNPVEKCEDVFLFWDLLENSHLSKKLDGAAIEDGIEPQTGEPIRMMVKIRSSGPMNAIREHCHYNLKPIYSKLVLPVIKLADLGYSNGGEQSKFGLEQIKLSEELKRWYSVTQMCEAILPVKYYEDPSLGLKDMALITRREAAKLDAAASEQGVFGSKVQLVYEPDTNSMEGLDRIESVATVEPKKLIKSVKSNVRARGHAIGLIMIRLVRKLKSGLKKSRAGHIFFPKSTDQIWVEHSKSGAKVAGEEKVDVSQQFIESLESMSDEDIEKLEDGAPSRMLGSRGKSGGLMGKLRRHAPTKRLSAMVASRKCSTVEKIVYTILILGALSVPIVVLVSMFG